MTRHEFHDAVLLYCVIVGASQTSGFRTPDHNQRVGGVIYSAHQADLGRDVVYDKPVADHYRIEWGTRLGLRVIIEGDHDHLQPLTWERG